MDAPQTWHYGLIAEYWAEFNDDFRPHEVPYFRRYVENGGGAALDVACGTGRLLVPYLRAGLDVDGCDVSPDMVELCRDKAEREGLRPMMVGHSQGGMQVVKVLRKLAGLSSSELHVCNPLTWKLPHSAYGPVIVLTTPMLMGSAALAFAASSNDAPMTNAIRVNIGVLRLRPPWSDFPTRPITNTI